MGIYLAQLPPAEVARLKAELAETIIANFCYPRFFDYRTESLRMRPVDRVKRQEVWLYLSSVDFTAWSRIDLMSPDFQRQIERLFIQFVQRNRSFFGEQGRKRMSDIRMLISSSATLVVQGLRNYITGQRQANVPPFGSPRPVMSWSAMTVKGHVDPSWELIASSTLLLQQQIQEVRGEVKPVASSDGRTAENRPANAPAQRVVRPSRPSGALEQAVSPATVPASNGKTAAQSNTRVTTPPSSATPLPATSPLPDNKPTTGPLKPPTPRVSAPAASIAPVAPAVPAASSASSASTAPTAPQAPVRKTLPQAPADTPVVTPMSSPTPTGPVAPIEQPRPADSIHNGASMPVKPTASVEQPTQPTQSAQPIQTVQPVQTQSPLAKVAPAAPPAIAPTPVLPISSTSVTPAEPPMQTRSMSPVQSSATGLASVGRGNPAMRIGEDDIAIFEQMRHQLIVWLRVEAIRAGLEVAGQTPSQLLEMLRQQEHMDETRLQVVSTLLNLANQVITNGQVTVLDYKQALMFHLMHTRR